MVTTTTSQARTEDNPLELADLSTSSPPLWVRVVTEPYPKFPRPDSRTFQHVRDWILLLCIACQIRFGIVLSVALLMGIAMRTGRGILVTVTSAPSHDHPVTFEEFNAFIAASFLFSSSLVLILVPRFWGIVYEQPTLRWAGMVFAFGILCSAAGGTLIFSISSPQESLKPQWTIANYCVGVGFYVCLYMAYWALLRWSRTMRQNRSDRYIPVHTQPGEGSEPTLV